MLHVSSRRRPARPANAAAAETTGQQGAASCKKCAESRLQGIRDTAFRAGFELGTRFANSCRQHTDDDATEELTVVHFPDAKLDSLVKEEWCYDADCKSVPGPNHVTLP